MNAKHNTSAAERTASTAHRRCPKNVHFLHIKKIEIS